MSGAGCRSGAEYADQLRELEGMTDSVMKRFPAIYLVQTDRATVADDTLWARGQLRVARTGAVGHRVRDAAATSLRAAAASPAVTSAVLQFLEGEEDLDWFMTQDLAIDCLAGAQSGEATYEPLVRFLKGHHDDERRVRIAHAMARQLPQWGVAVAAGASRLLLSIYLDKSSDRMQVYDAILGDPRVMANDDVRSLLVAEACDHWGAATRVIMALAAYPSDAERILQSWIDNGNLTLVETLCRLCVETGVQCLGPEQLSSMLRSPDAETRLWAIARTGYPPVPDARKGPAR
jgi:hypothetical protein